MKNINKGLYRPIHGLFCSAPACKLFAQPGDAFLCSFHFRAPVETWNEVTRRTGTLAFDLAGWRHTMLICARRDNGSPARIRECMDDWKNALIDLGISADKIEPHDGEDLDKWEERVMDAVIDFIVPATSVAPQMSFNLEDDQ